jgi:hypothetical protein
MILERRLYAEASGKESEGNRKIVHDPSGTRLQQLREELDSYRNVLEFDLASPVPVLGGPLRSFKRLIRRMFRSYIARQSAFNQYSLSLSESLHDETRRLARELEARVNYLELRLEFLERTLTSLTEQAWVSEETEQRHSDPAQERNASR